MARTKKAGRKAKSKANTKNGSVYGSIATTAKTKNKQKTTPSKKKAPSKHSMKLQTEAKKESHKQTKKKKAKIQVKLPKKNKPCPYESMPWYRSSEDGVSFVPSQQGNSSSGGVTLPTSHVSQDVLAKLDQELMAFADYVRLSEAEIEARECVIQHVTDIAGHVFHNGNKLKVSTEEVRIQAFGSYATPQVCTFASDVDLALWGVVPVPSHTVFEEEETQEEPPKKKQRRVQKWKEALAEMDAELDAMERESDGETREAAVKASSDAQDENKGEAQVSKPSAIDDGENASSGQFEDAEEEDFSFGIDREGASQFGSSSTVANKDPPCGQFDDAQQDDGLLFVIDRVGASDVGGADNVTTENTVGGDSEPSKKHAPEAGVAKEPESTQSVAAQDEPSDAIQPEGPNEAKADAKDLKVGQDGTSETKPSAIALQDSIGDGTSELATPKGATKEGSENDTVVAPAAASVVGGADDVMAENAAGGDSETSIEPAPEAGVASGPVGDGASVSTTPKDATNKGSDSTCGDGQPACAQDNTVGAPAADASDRALAPQKNGKGNADAPLVVDDSESDRQSVISVSSSDKDTADKLEALDKKCSPEKSDEASLSSTASIDREEWNTEWEDEDEPEVSFVSSKDMAAPKSVGPQGETRKLVVSVLQSLGRALRKSPIVETVEIRKFARVPIVVTGTHLGFEGDIAVGGHNGTDTSQYATCQAQRFKSFAPVVLLLKVLLGQQSLDKPFTGGLGSYKLYVLVAHHLENHIANGGTDRPSEVLLAFFFRFRKWGVSQSRDTPIETHLSRDTVVRCDGGVAEFQPVFNLEHCCRLFDRSWTRLMEEFESNDSTVSFLGRLVKSHVLSMQRKVCRKKALKLGNQFRNLAKKCHKKSSAASGRNLSAANGNIAATRASNNVDGDASADQLMAGYGVKRGPRGELVPRNRPDVDERQSVSDVIGRATKNRKNKKKQKRDEGLKAIAVHQE